MAISEINLKSPENRGNDFKKLSRKHPEVGKSILKGSWDFVGHSNKGTVQILNPLWLGNIEQNVKNKLWRKYGSVRKDCIGIGKNKAIIGIGAGQSFNKNKHVLKKIVDSDGCKDWRDRDFIIMASNHQFKPLLDMGIIPDFVMIVDGSDVIWNQLTQDISQKAQNTILLAGLHCSPKVLKEWTRQKREVRFFLTTTKEVHEAFRKFTGKNPIPHVVLQGGNVLNTMVTLGQQVFHALTFFAVGNDLSYPIKDDKEEQRTSYYSDGDYSTNRPGTGTGRDEAGGQKKWCGFSLKKKSNFGNPKDAYEIELEIVGTSKTLWVYKTWLETNILLNQYKGIDARVQYYNCTEGGILGVMAKKDDDESLADISNWFLLDETCKQWHTTMLEDAAKQFLTAKEAMKRWERGEMPFVAPSAIGSELRI